MDITHRERVKVAVDALVAMDKDEYVSVSRAVRMLSMLPVKVELVEYPELMPLVKMDFTKLLTLLKIVATKRDKMYVSPEQLERREYMRVYMANRRRANRTEVAHRKAVAKRAGREQHAHAKSH